MNKPNEPDSLPGVSRRTLIKGAAWSVPVVALGSAAPALALTEPIVPEFQAGTFCKHPGNPKYYHGVICFTNNTPDNILVTVDTLDINGTVRDATFSNAGQFVDTLLVFANQESCFYLDAGLFDNSANGAAILSWSYEYPAGTTNNETILAGTLNDGDLRPCGTGSASDQPSGDPPHATSGP